MSDKVIAISAGRKITQEEFDEFTKRIPAQQQQYIQTPEGKKQALTQYANYFLFEKLGQEKGYDKSEEFLKILEGTRRELLSQYALTQLVQNITASLAECRDYYEKNQAQFAAPEQAAASHILTDSEEKALSILSEIQDGKKTFEDAARESSTCPSGAKGGDLGTFGRGQMVKEFEDAVFHDPVIGQVTGPVKTQFGYHLIRVDKLNPAGVRPFEEVAEEISQKIIADKQNQLYMSERARLIKDYGLELYL